MQELVRRPVIYEDRTPDESNPKRTPERGQGYSMGKVIAERAFADAAAAHGGAAARTGSPRSRRPRGWAARSRPATAGRA